jgi:hypothetical protein
MIQSNTVMMAVTSTPLSLVDGPVQDSADAHRPGRLPPRHSRGAPSILEHIELRAQELQLHRLLHDQSLELADVLRRSYPARVSRIREPHPRLPFPRSESASSAAAPPRAIPSFRFSSANVSSPRSTRQICSRLKAAVKTLRPADFLAMRAIFVTAAYSPTAPTVPLTELPSGIQPRPLRTSPVHASPTLAVSDDSPVLSVASSEVLAWAVTPAEAASLPESWTSCWSLRHPTGQP